MSRPGTRREALRLVALGAVSLGGCLDRSDDQYRPGSVEVRNEGNRSTAATVTLYRYDRDLWVERGRTPTSENPEIPTAEPSERREFTFEVGSGETAIERAAITEPFCGPVILVEVTLVSGARSARRFSSMCGSGERAPEDGSNAHVRVTVEGADELDVTVLTSEPGAA